MSARNLAVLCALLSLCVATPSYAAIDEEAEQVRAQCEAQPDIKALHFGARKDALKKCVDTELDKRSAEREAAHQAELAKLPPVHRYAVCTDRGIADAMNYEARLASQVRALGGEPPTENTFQQRIKEMADCLDAKMPAALAEAQEAADLSMAVKDYYVSAQSLLRSVTDDKEKRAAAGQSYDEASNRLHMEAVAAGKW